MKAESDAAREANEKRIEVARIVELADVDKQKSLEVATRLQQQAAEVAEHEKQEQIAEARRKRAAAERALADAEAERERARQMIETVRLLEEVEREKKKQVLEAEASAEQRFVAEQRNADAEAYALRKHAEANKHAADAEADAMRKRAEAHAEAERLRAAGNKATAMVPVEVESARVAVDRERVESVVKAELEAREQHGKVAQDFEITKLRVEADKAVRVAFAAATSKLFSKMTAQLYGTPEDVTKIVGSLVQGQKVATTISGFFDAADDKTLEAVSRLEGGVKEVAEAVAERIGVKQTTDTTALDEGPVTIDAAE